MRYVPEASGKTFLKDAYANREGFLKGCLC